LTDLGSLAFEIYDDSACSYDFAEQGSAETDYAFNDTFVVLENNVENSNWDGGVHIMTNLDTHIYQTSISNVPHIPSLDARFVGIAIIPS
jgi:hypothetical protein